MWRLFKLTGWKLLRPSRAPWGEDTGLWSEGDWRWARRFDAPQDHLKAKRSGDKGDA